MDVTGILRVKAFELRESSVGGGATIKWALRLPDDQACMIIGGLVAWDESPMIDSSPSKLSVRFALHLEEFFDPAQALLDFAYTAAGESATYAGSPIGAPASIHLPSPGLIVAKDYLYATLNTANGTSTGGGVLYAWWYPVTIDRTVKQLLLRTQ
jgi:hypothetical protein